VHVMVVRMAVDPERAGEVTRHLREDVAVYEQLASA
jgi:hypothetical protein